MQIPNKKMHHFTKWELATEEVAIIVILSVLFTATCFAASALLPIRAALVQCGSRADLPVKCREDQRCCALLERRGGVTPVPVASEESSEGGGREPSAGLTRVKDDQAANE